MSLCNLRRPASKKGNRHRSSGRPSRERSADVQAKDQRADSKAAGQLRAADRVYGWTLDGNFQLRSPANDLSLRGVRERISVGIFGQPVAPEIRVLQLG